MTQQSEHAHDKLADQARSQYEPWRSLNLVYLIFLFFPLFFPFNKNWQPWAASLVALALFLPIYWRSYAMEQTAALRSALLMALLGFALAFFHPGGQTLVIYAMATLGFHQPARVAIMISAMLLAIFALLALKIGYGWFGVVPNALIGTAVLVGAIFGRRELQLNAKLHLSRVELERHARNAERERISRDLHDLLGHTLSVIALKSELARRLAPKHVEAAVLEIAEVETIAREALIQVRQAVTGMRATEFSAELATARVTLISTGIELNSAQPLPILSAEYSQALGLVLREAVTNVLRHANANRVEIQLYQRDALELIVKDNGMGSVKAAGNGINGMRERLLALGGELQITAVVGKGTEVRACLPRLSSIVASSQANDSVAALPVAFGSASAGRA
jgi:two-component system, NarL family, sensor histidine kinase DesK